MTDGHRSGWPGWERSGWPGWERSGWERSGWERSGWPVPVREQSRRVSGTELRIGDVERDEAIHELGEHFAAGRLSREEFDQRSGQALESRVRGDLEPLFGDLPALARARRTPASGPPSGRGGPPLFWFAPIMIVATILTTVLVTGAVVTAGAPWVLWVLLAFFLLGRGRRRQRIPRPQGPDLLHVSGSAPSGDGADSRRWSRFA